MDLLNLQHQNKGNNEETRNQQAQAESADGTEPLYHSFGLYFPRINHQPASAAESGPDYLSHKRIVKIYCKSDPTFHVTIREDKVVFAPADPSDEFQNWYKDEKYTSVKDEEGFPSFALVNVADGRAINHSPGFGNPVELKPYNPDVVDESMLWTHGRDLGDGYRAVRTLSNIKLVLNASRGTKLCGGIHDGTAVLVWEWAGNYSNERWRITTQKKFLMTSQEYESK